VPFLKLYADGKVIEELDEISIEKSGENKNYETAVKFMIERAIAGGAITNSKEPVQQTRFSLESIRKT